MGKLMNLYGEIIGTTDGPDRMDYSAAATNTLPGGKTVSDLALNNKTETPSLIPATDIPKKTIEDFYPSGFNPSAVPEAPTYNYTPSTFTTPTPLVPLAPGMVATPTKDYRSQWQNEENNRQQMAQGSYNADLARYQGELDNYNNALSYAQKMFDSYNDNLYKNNILEETKRSNDFQNSLSLLPYSQLTKAQEVTNAMNKLGMGTASDADYSLLGLSPGTQPWDIRYQQALLNLKQNTGGGGSGGSGYKTAQAIDDAIAIYNATGVVPDILKQAFPEMAGQEKVGGTKGYAVDRLDTYIDNLRSQLKTPESVKAYVQKSNELEPAFRRAVLQRINQLVK